MLMSGRNQHNIIIILQLKINKEEKGQKKKIKMFSPSTGRIGFYLFEKWNVEEREGLEGKARLYLGHIRYETVRYVSLQFKRETSTRDINW